MKKRTIIFIAVMILVMIAAACVGIGVFQKFDAQGYIQASLEQAFFGDTVKMEELLDEADPEELYQKYEDGIVSFVENNIISGVTVSEEQKEQYILLCKEIFGAMQFQVQEAEKISRKEYNVPVTYQSVNVFQLFIDAIEQEKLRIAEKVEKGEYQGTEEEITLEIQEEFSENAYEMLQEAFVQMEYGETETVVFKVQKGASELFQVNENDIENFIVKILGLDEIQD